MGYNGYDVKKILEWKCPDEMDARVVAMPNIPRPTHGLNPRTLLGRSTWDKMRTTCYAKAGYKCEVCGYEAGRGMCDAHELYDIDYKAGTVKFVRTVCLCRQCHRLCIHTGRAITLFKDGNPMFPKEKLLEGAEHAFKLIYDYNKAHPEADLRAYATFLEYLKHDELRAPMEGLIKNYDMKFYVEDTKKMAEWPEWKLIVGRKEYSTPYTDHHAWEEAMKEQNKKDTDRLRAKAMTRFQGGVYDEVDEIIKSLDK